MDPTKHRVAANSQDQRLTVSPQESIDLPQRSVKIQIIEVPGC
jgi:hypothetical protein